MFILLNFMTAIYANYVRYEFTMPLALQQRHTELKQTHTHMLIQLISLCLLATDFHSNGNGLFLIEWRTLFTDIGAKSSAAIIIQIQEVRPFLSSL